MEREESNFMMCNVPLSRNARCFLGSSANRTASRRVASVGVRYRTYDRRAAMQHISRNMSPRLSAVTVRLVARRVPRSVRRLDSPGEDATESEATGRGGPRCCTCRCGSSPGLGPGRYLQRRAGAAVAACRLFLYFFLPRVAASRTESRVGAAPLLGR